MDVNFRFDVEFVWGLFVLFLPLCYLSMAKQRNKHKEVIVLSFTNYLLFAKYFFMIQNLKKREEKTPKGLFKNICDFIGRGQTPFNFLVWLNFISLLNVEKQKK